MKKFIYITILLFSIIGIGYAGTDEEHNAWLEQIIIGGDLEKDRSTSVDENTNTTNTYEYQIPKIKYALPEDEAIKLNILEETILLVMDQHGSYNRNQYVGYFNSIKSYFHNPSWFPSDFEKISFSTGKSWNYEKLTHLGWNNWKNNAISQERKDLLTHVIKNIFPAATPSETEKLCIFFCDIHVLGDIFGDIESLQNTNSQKLNSQMTSDMRMTLNQFCSEFCSCLPLLLGSESICICTKIEERSRIATGYLNGKNAKQITLTRYIQYIQNAGYKVKTGTNSYTSKISQIEDSIQNILYLRVSDLLIQRPFFQNAFPELCKIKGFDYKDYKSFCRNEKNWDKFINYEDKYEITNEEIDRGKLRRRISEVYGKNSDYFKNHNLEAAHILPGNLDHDNPQIKAAREIVNESIGINHPANCVMLPNNMNLADLYYVKGHHGSGGYVHSEDFLEKLAIEIQNAAAPFRKNYKCKECKQAVCEVLMNAQKHLLTQDTNHNY